jgi:type IV secretory pathway TrbF-like protein
MNKNTSMTAPLELPAGEAPAPHIVRGRREWDDRQAQLVSRHRTDRMISLACLGIAAFCAFGYFTKDTHYEPPIIVRQDSLGEFTTIGRAGMNSPPDDIAVAATLKAWIRHAREISVDSHTMKSAILDAYKPLADGGKANAQLNDYYAAKPEDNPFDRAGREVVYVENESALPSKADQTDNPWAHGRARDPRTFNVEWKERTEDRTGQLKSEKWWRAELVISWKQPGSKAEADRAPDGIWINSLAWTER